MLELIQKRSKSNYPDGYVFIVHRKKIIEKMDKKQYENSNFNS